MTIEYKILTEKPREESGSKTSRKYLYQKDLSLFLMLTAHSKKNEDYLFLFDFHEDLVVSKSSTELKNLTCYQIKSKDSSHWNLGLLTGKKAGSLSIVSKLYNNKLVFEDAIKSLVFISNGKFKLNKLKSDADSMSKVIISGNDLSDVDVKKIKDVIEDELSISVSNIENLLNFEVTKLSNLDSSTHCVGALAGLINAINPKSQINSQLAYEQVINEITRKTNETVSDKTFSNISEIFILKGISRDQFEKFLNYAGLYKSVDEEWNQIQSTLETCGLGYLEILRFKSAWREMCGRLIADSNNIPLISLKKEIKERIIREQKELRNFNLIQIVNHVYGFVSRGMYDEYFVKCLIIYCLHE